MKRFSKLAAVVAAVSLALSACGSGEDSKKSSGGSPAESRELTVWAWDPAFNIKALREAEKVYQKSNPEFKRNIQEMTWDDIQAQLVTLAQSRQTTQLPDLFLMQNNAFQKNAINYPELFNDMEGAKISWSEFPESVTAYSVIENRHYGVPFDSGTAITALRTDYLAEAGFTPEDFTDITWDKFIEQGKVVLEKTGKPMMSALAGESDTLLMMLQSAGGSLFDDKGRPALVDDKILSRAVDTYKQLVDTGVLREVNSWDEHIRDLVSGNVASAINGVWIVGSIQSAGDQAGKWMMTNVPKLDGVDGATNYTANGGSSWAVSSNANTQLAYDFLAKTFAGSTELYDTILPESGAVANWIPAGKSKVYAEKQPFWNNQKIYQKVVEFSVKVPSNNTGVYYYDARDATSAALTEIIKGGDKAAALQKAQDTIEFAMK